jgi:diguanylate cyclase (GGDEF)-like protein
MKTYPRLLLPALIVFFIALLSYNYIEGQSVNYEIQQNQIHRYITQLEKADANLDRQILRMDSWYFSNYDKVNLAYRQYLDILDGLPQMPDELKASIPKIKRHLKMKHSLVEKLKSSNAVLRNSVNYLPELVSALDLDIDSALQNGEITLRQSSKLRHSVQDIVFHGVTRQLISRVSIKPDLSPPLQRLPIKVEKSWQEMQKHIEVLVKYKQRDEELNDQLEKTQLSGQLELLNSAFAGYLLEKEESQQLQKWWLIGYFLVAIILIIVLFFAVRYYRKQHSLHRLESLTDPLTGLANRRKLTEQIPAYLAQARHNNDTVGILFIDLDGFKNVNDNMGHKRGDLLLQKISSSMQSSLRQNDLIARIGGDEFVVVIPCANASNLRRIAQNLINICTITVDYMNKELKVSASIGISCYPDDTRRPHELLEFADKAMYQAKLNGKSCIAFYIDINT